MLTNSLYQVDRCTTLSQLDALEKEWAELISGIPSAPLFLSWEWIRTWWAYFGKGRELWLLTARDNQGKLLGIAPLEKEIHNINWAKLRVIGFIGIGLTHPIRLNILTHQSYKEGLLGAFLDYLLSQSGQWDVLTFASQSLDSDLYNLLTSERGTLHIGKKTINIFIPLPGDWDTYSRTLTKKLRRNLKYFRSKLENENSGAISFSYVTDLRELSEIMKKLEEFNQDRWHARKRISNFDYSAYTNFHQEFATLALQRGWLRLNKLNVSDRLIAMCYNFRFHDCIYAQAIGFDLDWSGYSPGRLTVANSIQKSIQEGAHEYNWLGGEEEYKLAWTDQMNIERELLFSNNLVGRIWIGWKSLVLNIHELLLTKGRQWLPKSVRDRYNQFISARHRKKAQIEEKDSD